MNKITLGERIASRRKELGMTQAELAEKMNVTDKAVSKWERDLSCPEISTLPKLAEIFDVSVDELMQAKGKTKNEDIAGTALKAVALAMGVAVTVLTIMDKVDSKSAFGMLGIGLVSLALNSLKTK